jgi:hypothetical protein
MPRDANDLKALIMAGDSYSETITIDYMGEQFAIQIRPLTEGELTDVARSMKVSTKMIKGIREKIQVGKTLTETEKAALEKEAVDAIINSGEMIEIGDMEYMDFVLNREYCRRGIVDKGLANLVPNFRYGLTAMISARIQTISNVPPAVVANFFGQKKDS